MQLELPGLDEYYKPDEGLQERATKELIASYLDHGQPNPRVMYICKTMINISRNFDALNLKGRDTSRVMAQLLSWYQALEEQTASYQDMSDGLKQLVAMSSSANYRANAD